MAFVTTTSPDLYATTSNLEELPAGADPLQYADDDKMNQILVGLTALHGWASGVPVSETANGHFMALAAGSSAAVSVAAGVRIRQSSGALDYSYNAGAYVRLLSKLTLASQDAGDIMYASDASTWVRLAKGTDGDVLTLAGGVPTWAAGGGGAGDITAVVAGAGLTGGAASGSATLDIVATNTSLTVNADDIGVNFGHAFTWTAQHAFAVGAVGTPSISFAGDLNTGLYWIGADSFGLATGGALRMSVNTGSISTTVPYLAPDASAAAPAFSFGTDAGNGMYLNTTDTLGWATNGVLRLSLSTTGLTSTLPIRAPAGSAALPSLVFASDATKGFYDLASNEIGIGIAGVQKGKIRTVATIGRMEIDEVRALNGQDFFFIRSSGKAIFGTETSGNIIEMQSYKTTGSTTDAFRAWMFTGTATAGNLLSVGDGGTYAQKFAVDFAGRCDYPSAITQTTVGGAGAASALPATPTGYLHIRIGGVPGTPGTIVLVPYYDWDGP